MENLSEDIYVIVDIFFFLKQFYSSLDGSQTTIVWSPSPARGTIGVFLLTFLWQFKEKNYKRFILNKELL